MKFLADFFTIGEDGRSANEDKLIELADCLLSKTLGLRMVETTVQDCYNLHLPDGYGGSGHRFATHSCMEGRLIGEFYNLLPVHGMMIKRDGEGVGRFLLWDLPDGRQYVDRLYCREREASACLELIDAEYPNALKYPLENDEILDIQFTDITPFEGPVLLPYVDSFPFLMEKEGKMYLSNVQTPHNGACCQTTVHFASTCDSYRIKKCPHCGKIWFSSGIGSTEEQRNHKYICPSYMPRKKELQAYLKIYRNMESSLRNIGGTNDRPEEFVYEV